MSSVELQHPPCNPIPWMVVIGGVEFISEPRRTAYFAAASIRTERGAPAYSECSTVMPLEEWRTKMTTSLQIHNNGPLPVKVIPVTKDENGTSDGFPYTVGPGENCPTVYVHGGSGIRIEEVSETKEG